MVVVITVLGVIIFIAAAVPLVQRFVPSFGGKVTDSQRELFQRLPHYDGKRFAYPVPTKMNTSVKDMFPVAWEFLKGSPGRRPSSPIPMIALKKEDLRPPAYPRVIWFGHSAALLQLDGLTILIDPMFGLAPSPFPMVGGKRFNGKLPMELDDLPNLDYILLSHDHYDHLDYGTIRALKKKVARYIVPLGVGQHLRR